MVHFTFALLQQEGALASSSLLAGLNALRKANMHGEDRGKFYTAFFQLSIGFERLMKLVIIINHMVNNDYKPMTDEELRKNYGHKIKKLYKSCQEISIDLGLEKLEFFDEESIEWEMIHFLHEFALSSRYYNLSKLSDSHKNDDPMAEWWKIINTILLTDVSVKKRQKIENETLKACDDFYGNTFTHMRGMNGELLTTFDAIAGHRLVEAAAPYCVWHLHRILEPFYRIVSTICDAAHEQERIRGESFPVIPYMEEFFTFLLHDRSSVLRKKSWS